MNIKEISEKLGLSFLNEAEPSKEVKGGYCGDLLSFVMSHAKCGDCWFTVIRSHIIVSARRQTGVHV